MPLNLQPVEPVNQRHTAGEAWLHHYAVVNGMHFHYVEAGSGPLVVLLHGFPEFYYSWRHQIPYLATAGFRVVAPDLRGYNETEKPAGVANYRLSLLVEDVCALVEHAGEKRATIVGHDWGGVLAWRLAVQRPELVRQLVVLNAPHPGALRRELKNPAQWLRSSYAGFFQLPWLPEWTIRAKNFWLVERILTRQPVNPGAFTADDIKLYKEALSQPEALTAALNYYRAALRFPGDSLGHIREIAVPALVIWGEQDPALSVRLSEQLERWVPNIQVTRLSNASHWVQNDCPRQVNELMCDFLERHR